MNGNLDTPGAPAHWTLEKTPEDNVQFSSGSFARHNGSVGMWLRSFAGGDAKVVQTVAGSPGGNYTFGAWSKWEPNISVAIEGSTTETFLKMEFLDAANAVIGTPAMLDLRTVQMRPMRVAGVLFERRGTRWHGNVRVSAGATGMGNSGSGPQSAMFDDFSLELAGAGTRQLARIGGAGTECCAAGGDRSHGTCAT